MGLLDSLEGIEALHMSVNGITSRGAFLDFNHESLERPEDFSCLCICVLISSNAKYVRQCRSNFQSRTKAGQIREFSEN